MSDIESPNGESELVVWLNAWISKFTENDGWAESMYSLLLQEANSYVSKFCSDEINLLPELPAEACNSDEVREVFRQKVIARFTKLRDAIDDPESTEGPIANNKIRIDGEVYSVKGDKPWGILYYMWKRERALEDDVTEKVWGHDYRSVDFKGAVNKANEALLAGSYPKVLHRKSGFIFWD